MWFCGIGAMLLETIDDASEVIEGAADETAIRTGLGNSTIITMVLRVESGLMVCRGLIMDR